MFILTLVFYLVAAVAAETEETKEGKQLSIFNVIRFPNSNCVGSGSLNGTCYTASECTSLSGTASGACASSFGVCCVFSLSCGQRTSANISYATISSFDTNTGTDPCIYTFCKCSDDICKLRIDYESMVIAGPDADTVTFLQGANYGRCNTDTLSVGVPGFTPPPVICGYNTGQHMWVPASDSCVTINLDIDTASSATTRSWNIRVSQYECGNLRAPEENCLQYHTSTTGRFATFNWDTSSSSNLKTSIYPNVHLADQYYNICIRRTRGYCSVCYSPELIATQPTALATEGSSFGVSAASDAAPTFTVNNGAGCTGITTSNTDDTAAVGKGDYITIESAQDLVGTATGIGIDKLCGIQFNAGSIADTATETVCSWKTPFRVGVHFDDSEAIVVTANIADANNFNAVENAANPPATTSLGAGVGSNGFWLAYWQNTC